MDNKDPTWGLERAMPSQDDRGGRAVAFDLDPMGARLFSELSTAHVGQALAIVLDDRIVSAPVLEGPITGGGVRITGGTGGFSEAEAGYLINTLNAGALPAQLSSEPVVERTVGPQLGADNLRAGLIACYFGLGVVALFLIGYYFRAGVVAFVAVLMNMLLILASMAAMNATFTLPSIAGIILALGMSVDANVLIFERLREEQARGLSIRMSLRNAYDRALSAILDSNITTGITAAILYIFGSEEVKGFGLTLLIGIFASLFTALFLTKTIFGIMVEKFGTQKLTDLPTRVPAWNRLLTPNIDWMRKAPLFMAVSMLFIVGGCALFSWYFVQGRVLDVEFAGGTTAQLELREPTTMEEIRSYLQADTGPLADAQVVAIEPPAGLPNNTSYEVVVPETDRNAVTTEIITRLGDRLRMRQASTFAGHDRGFEEVLRDAVFPIDEGLRDPGGVPIDQGLLAEHAGGVAIVLRDMEPMLDRDDLLSRFNHQRLKSAYDAEGLRGGVNVAVEVYTDMKAAVFLVSNDRFAYDPTDPEVQRQWQADFAQPVWTLISDAVANPDELQKVTNIGGQVAGEFQRDATIALFLSILAIVAYVWLRFGDLKFGGATVLSLAHDTLFVIAAVGYAHLLAHTFFGTILLLDPFRLNLTMVAAILTVIGFSMNDTVVVFDRIRENRGKYGKLTRQVINDSINQTLSRTLLTGGTTIATIALMYIIGGPGIHGFTFAMLVGILTGTYSSIAIASPVLLWGRAGQSAPGGAAATS
jgi:SecD/SecF fusion protein